MAESVRILDRLCAAAPTISVGIATADLAALGAEVAVLEKAGVGLVHFDVMDGCFCPAMTFGPPLIKAVRTPLIKDVHLLVANPLDKLAACVAAGADMVTIHVETTPHPHRVLQALGEMTNANDPARGLVRGVALNPGTPLETLDPLIEEVDVVFLLAVNPGWGGQKFIRFTRRRIEKLLQILHAAKRTILIGIDGGITMDNVGDAVHMGADIVVTGSAVFDGKAAEQNARRMLSMVREVSRRTS